MRFENNGVTSSQSAGVSNGASSVNGASSLKGSFATDMQSNGTSGGSRNGSTGKLEAGVGENGVLLAPVVSPPKTDYFGHDREEVSRILIQALVDLGYQRAASTLEEESEYTLESPCVSSFRDAVLRGEWSRAETLLYSMQIHQDADLTVGSRCPH